MGFLYLKPNNSAKYDFSKWVLRAWREIPEEVVTKSFWSCGIMNNLDKTQVDDVSDNNTRSTNDNAKKHHEEASCLLFVDEGYDGYSTAQK